MDIVYVASKTMKDFHKSDKFVRSLMGPIGSGKSVDPTKMVLGNQDGL
jgi:hypothetical protein